ncbi:Hypothetical protein CpMEX30_1427 [Corynebacterium pseudotuberculosis]|uniref:hypothetical protein n=1 Tax=Corynebacterium pseudotuberculosis TaxID=1719 RepID=UPI00094765A1|nr:hypothetical protein [Corynebacterium pseudotuberculosis]APQ54455.1 Hypothetical protein CpMEX30_1427 [Corynebacterium pseudotuberculosis]
MHKQDSGSFISASDEHAHDASDAVTRTGNDLESKNARGSLPEKRAKLKWKVSEKTGNFSAVLVAIVCIYAGLGALWPVIRPRYDATLAEGGGLQLMPGENVEFISFAQFVGITSLVAVVLAISLLKLSPHRGGVALLLWFGTWIFIGEGVFLFVGDLVSELVSGVGRAKELHIGESISFIPPLSPGIAARLAPGFVGMAVYWCRMYLNIDEADVEDFDKSAESQD